MAVGNNGSISRGRKSAAKAPAQQQDLEVRVVEYAAGEETVKLSPGIVRKYLVRGNGEVTDQEIVMFVNLCRFQHLNPFLNEAYLIKFGGQPATIVTGKEAMTKRAMRNPKYRGQQAGVVVMDKETGDIQERVGSMVLPFEQLVGGWAKVYVDGFEHPIETTVGLGEYIGVKKDGTVNSQWSQKPGTMIRKVALMQALREAFPDDLGGMYDESEVGAEAAMADQQPVQIIEPDDPKAEPLPDSVFTDEQATIEELEDF